MSSSATQDETGSDSSAVDARPTPPPSTGKSATTSKPRPRNLPPYHVLLLDDMDHTHEYVIEMMRSIFGYPAERGYQIAEEVHRRRKAIVYTTHQELAELKRDQIHAFGTDARVATCAGSMSACIVAAE